MICRYLNCGQVGEEGGRAGGGGLTYSLIQGFRLFLGQCIGNEHASKSGKCTVA